METADPLWTELIAQVIAPHVSSDTLHKYVRNPERMSGRQRGQDFVLTFGEAWSLQWLGSRGLLDRCREHLRARYGMKLVTEAPEHE